MTWLALHGFMGSADQMRPLLKELPHVAPKLCGHPTYFDSYAAQINALAKLKASAIFGYSMGARLGLSLLCRFPTRYRHALLIGGSFGLGDARARDERRKLDENRAQMLLKTGTRRFVSDWEALPLFASQTRLPTHILDAQRAIRCAHSPEGLAHSLQTIGLGNMPDLRQMLPGVQTPIDWVVGEEDIKFVAIAQEAQTLLPNIRLHIVPDCGHNVLLEAPKRIRALLRASSFPE